MGRYIIEEDPEENDGCTVILLFIIAAIVFAFIA